ELALDLGHRGLECLVLLHAGLPGAPVAVSTAVPPRDGAVPLTVAMIVRRSAESEHLFVTSVRPCARPRDGSRHTAVSARRSRWSAAATDRSRTWPRSPRRSNAVASTASGPATPMCTRPTGERTVPPPGPATPVIDTPQSAPVRRRTPQAM